MDNERWEKLQTLFHAAIELQGEQRRQAILHSTSDPSLQAEVDALCREYESLGDLLSVPDEGSGLADALQKNECLLNRFHIIGLIGRGGMGEVYEARDAHLHDQRVALKTLRPDAVGDAKLERRFVQELLLARDVNHPNVCPIFDLFDCEGPNGPIRFVTMKLIEGETLRQMLDRTGPLPVATALSLAGQIGAGLGAAHAKGVVHGDLKPANVMVASGAKGLEASITDFGLARRWSLDSQTQATIAGGTPAYMSPEQAAGKRPTPASDIYSFGLILKELITGSQEQDPPATKVPSAWRRVWRRCTDVDPSRRFATASEATAQLARRPWRVPSAIAAGVVLLAAAMWNPALRERWQKLTSPLPEIRHVAVLPFQSQGDLLFKQLGETLPDDIVSTLSRGERSQQKLWVVPATDVRTQHVTTAAQARDAFRATLALRGSAVGDSNNARLRLELVDTATNAVLRAKEIVSPLDEIFRLSEYASFETARMLDVTARPDDLVSARNGTHNAEAYRQFEAGRVAYRARTSAEIDKAIQLFQTAVELDPNYAEAYANLAEAYAGRYYFSKDPSTLDLAERNSAKAREVAPNSSKVHVISALVLDTSGKISASIAELNRALEIDPNNAEALALLARAYARAGKVQDAESAYKRLIELRPNYWAAYNSFGSFYFGQGKYAEAEKLFRYVTSIAPMNVMGFNNLGGVYALTGRCSEAIEQLQKSIAIKPSAGAYTNLGKCYFDLKRFPEAAESMSRAVQLLPSEHVLWRNLGDAYLFVKGSEHLAQSAYRKAVEAAERVRKVNPSDPQTLSSLALYHAKLKEAAAAEALLSSDPVKVSNDLNLRFRNAVCLELLGKRSEALKQLEVAVTAGFPLSQVTSAFELDTLRRDPRYQSVIARASEYKGRK